MKTNTRDVFEHIGSLFYAIAADQKVQPLEVAELKLLVSRDWLPRNETVKTTVPDETHYIMFTMDSLAAENTPASEAFNEFVKYYTAQPEAFTDEIKQRVLDTAFSIVRIFNGDNPEDNNMLKALRELVESGKVDA